METVAERWKHFPNWEEVRAKLKPGSKNGKSKRAKEQKSRIARITLRDWVRTLRIWAKLEIIWEIRAESIRSISFTRRSKPSLMMNV